MANIVFYVLLALLPTQLAYHFWPASAFVYGIRVDYLAPTIYLTDVLVVLLFVLSDAKKKFFSKKVLLLLLFALLNIYFSKSIEVSVYKWVKVFEMLFLGIYVAKNLTTKLFNNSIKILLYSSVTVSVIGIIQFIKLSTLGFPLNLLGERTFSASTPGVALASLFGQDFMRSYSTFSHPNSLAGFLGVMIILIFMFTKRKITPIIKLGVLIILICFLLTFSFSAFVSLFFVGAIALFVKNKRHFWKILALIVFVVFITGIAFPIFIPKGFVVADNTSERVIQRLELANVSGGLIKQNPIFGVGLGNFISTHWLLQPVHNIILLIFSEVGIFGVLIFYALISSSIQRLKSKNLKTLALVTIFILLTGSVDHYWLTLQQNML
ncbi:O-antigen ligase family protein, partial [Patescibacteria group bacterium]